MSVKAKIAEYMRELTGEFSKIAGLRYSEVAAVLDDEKNAAEAAQSGRPASEYAHELADVLRLTRMDSGAEPEAVRRGNLVKLSLVELAAMNKNWSYSGEGPGFAYAVTEAGTLRIGAIRSNDGLLAYEAAYSNEAPKLSVLASDPVRVVQAPPVGFEQIGTAPDLGEALNAGLEHLKNLKPAVAPRQAP